jgi:CRISPR/Cas system-associated exonuclease Cas4 (RecB family)
MMDFSLTTTTSHRFSAVHSFGWRIDIDDIDSAASQRQEDPTCLRVKFFFRRDKMKISKSRLLCYMTCPEKYFLSYELRIKPLKTPSELLIGSSTHHLITSYFMETACGKSHNGSVDLQEILEDFWLPYSPDNTDFPTMEDLKAAMQQSLGFARLFIDETDLKPLEVEYKFTLPVINVETGEVLSDIELTGFIDIIDHPNGANRVVEIKTKAKRPDDFGAQTSIELTCYAYWLRFLDDREAIPVSYVNIIKTKKPYIHWQDQERSTGDFIDLFHTIKTIAANISDARFYKNPGVHCNWCDYTSICGRDIKTATEIFGQEALEDLRETRLAWN